MRDVAVIGGGLSGLAACGELERLGARYTLIEVKARLGGAIRSGCEGGFLMDGAAFAFRPFHDRALLACLGLADATRPLNDQTWLFAHGTETLTQALAGRLRGGRLTRMAVSSVGRLGPRFTICLENGIMLDAGALVLALPAPYAARALKTLRPAAAQRLRGFRYDSISRLSLGYHKRDLPARLRSVDADDIAFLFSADRPSRLPDRDHRLIQAGWRGDPATPPDEMLRRVVESMNLPPPLAWRVDFWAEADLLAGQAESREADVSKIRADLPPGLLLVGSDYLPGPATRPGVARLEERILAGQAAARDACAHYQASKSR